MNTFRRFCAAAAATTLVAGAASAGNFLGDFEVESEGPADLTGDNFNAVTDVIFQEPALGFDTVLIDGMIDFGNDPFTNSGTFTFEGADGDLFAAFDGFVFVNDSFVSSAGDFTITGGTGVFDGVTGSGVFTVFVDDEGIAQANFGGTIVPTPGALALLGIAGCGALGRRRRR